MNILYIIGNGFDLNIGLKTSYSEFYKYYKHTISKNENINSLKKNISNNFENWGDLELALGEYTKKLSDLEAFDDIFDDLVEQLSEFLKIQEKSIDISELMYSKFFDDILNPENYLNNTEKTVIESYKKLFPSEDWYIDIFTFNYTKIIELFFDQKKEIGLLHPFNNNAKVKIREVEHIHGYLRERLVLGINDASQLHNENFKNNEDVLDAIIKTKHNSSLGHNIDNLFKSKINEAHLICLFGTSLGETDNTWWEALGSKFKNNSIPILYFTKGNIPINPLMSYKNNREKRKIKSYLIKKLKLEEMDNSNFEDKIFISIDNEMFKDIIKFSSASIIVIDEE